VPREWRGKRDHDEAGETVCEARDGIASAWGIEGSTRALHRDLGGQLLNKPNFA